MAERSLMMMFPDDEQVSNLVMFKESSSSVIGYLFSRNNTNEVKKDDYSNNYGIYFLFNDAEENPAVYIGQSSNGIDRIVNHKQNKEFWTYCMLFVTDNNSFDKSLIDYLEYYFIREFEDTIYTLENVEARSKQPNYDRFLSSNYQSFANQIKFMLEANRIKFTKEKNSTPNDKACQFTPKSNNHNATLVYDGELFILLKGSIIKKSQECADNTGFVERKFDSLVNNNQAELIGDNMAKLKSDVAFKTPTAAARMVTAYNVNGWTFWDGLEDIRKSIKL